MIPFFVPVFRFVFLNDDTESRVLFPGGDFTDGLVGVLEDRLDDDFDDELVFLLCAGGDWSALSFLAGGLGGSSPSDLGVPSL